MSAYALLDQSYREYRSKVRELYGREADIRIREEMARDHFSDDVFEAENEQILFYDENHRRYFESAAEKAILDDGLECWMISVP